MTLVVLAQGLWVYKEEYSDLESSVSDPVCMNRDAKIHDKYLVFSVSALPLM